MNTRPERRASVCLSHVVAALLPLAELTALGFLLIASPVAAEFQTVSVRRDLSGFATIDPIVGQNAFDSDGLDETGQGPMDATVESEASVGDAVAGSSAFNVSEADLGGFSVNAGFAASASIGTSADFAEALGASRMFFDFVVGVATTVRTVGTLEASGNGVANYLLLGPESILLNLSVRDDLVSVDEELHLAPGFYRLSLSTSGYGQSFPEGGTSASGNFTIALFEENSAGLEDALASTSPEARLAPNPAVSSTRISLRGQADRTHDVAIVDAAGRAVRAFGRVPGSAEFDWDLRDDAGRDIPQGLYFVRIEGAGQPLRVLVLRR